MVLFITEQGSRITRQGRVLMVSKNGEKIFMYPFEAISQLVIMGQVEISTGMLGLLMRSGVDTVLLTRDGRYKGRIVGETSKNILLREIQFARRSDVAFVNQLSRQILLAKIRNSRNLLRRQQRNLYEDHQQRIENALKSVERAPGLAALRGFEGQFAALYFKIFPQLLREAFGFRKRQKHPSPDPLNILLSFGYTLLFNTLYALVETAGLDPYAGFFHQSSYGHPALASDLMEPYRAPIIDRLIIRLVNGEKLTRESFEKTEGGWRFKEESLKIFVTEYQQRLLTRFTYNERQETLWSVLQKDVQQFCRCLKGESDDYRPFIFN